MIDEQLHLPNAAVAVDLSAASELVDRAVAILEPHGDLLGGIRYHVSQLARESNGIGIVTFVDPAHVRPKRDPGRCFLRAGFRRDGTTGSGLVALRMPADELPTMLRPARPAGQLAMEVGA